MDKIQLKSVFIAVIILLIYNESTSQITQEWVRSFSLSSNNSQVSNDITTDANGNIYVTGYNAAGYSESDMVTIKYNSSGDYQWAKIYYNPNIAYCHEKGKCIASYSAGGQNYIYAAGEVTYSGYTQYIILLKYDGNGNQKWAKGIYLASFNLNHILKKITTDSSGNVYVTGSTTDKLFLVKYDSAGTQKIYSAYDNPPGYSFGQGNDIKVNSSGEIFVSGQTRNSSFLVTPTMIKFDPNGNILYRKLFTNFIQSDGNDSKISLGNSSNIYLGFKQNNDYGIIKCNNAGDTVWTRRYNGTSNSDDIFNALAVDVNENVYATGRVNGGYGDVGTVKYDSSGNFLWVKTYAGLNGWPDEGRDIKLDASGNVYVAGSIEVSVGQKSLMLKYNPAGTLLWSREYDFAVTDYEDAIALAIDINGDPVSTGSCGYITLSDYATIKYNSSGTLQWANKYNGSQTSTDAVNSITTDKYGNVYAIGRVRSGQFGDNIQIVKYNSAGVKKWEYNRGGSVNEDIEDAGNAITVDNNGNVYFTGIMHTSIAGNKRDVYTGKLDSNGNIAWPHPFGQLLGGGGNDEGVEIALDTLGNIYVGYNYEITTGNIKFGVRKYTPSGATMWGYTYSGAGTGIDQLRDMKVDKYGNVYLLGNTASALSGINIVTIKVNSSGVFQWVNTFNGTANGDDDSRSLDVEDNGNVYITGSALNSGSGNDIVAIKYNQSGLQLWSYGMSNGNTLKETGAVIKYSSKDSLVRLSGDIENFSRLNNYSIYLNSTGNGVGTIVSYPYGNTKIYGGALNDAGYLNYAYAADSAGSRYNFRIKNLIGLSYFSGTTAGDHVPAINESVATYGSSVYAGVTSFDTVKGNMMTIVKYKSPNYRLHFQALIQGFVYPGSYLMTADTIRIKIRNSSPPYSIVDSGKGILDYTGMLSNLPFYNISKNNSYYIVMNHRNSIETWSKTPATFTPGLFSESFKIQSRVYGDNVIQVPSFSEYAVYSGDVNQDGAVDASDLSDVENAASEALEGYVNTDVTGDDYVDATDLSLVENNAANSVNAVVP